jgi:hypothetical protein
MTEPVSFDSVVDIGRANDLLDQITLKPFTSPTIFITAVRAVLDLHGIVLPMMELDGLDPVPLSIDVQDPVEVEGEYVYPIEDERGDQTDAYIYIIVNRNDQGHYECYAQVVDQEELEFLVSIDPADYPDTDTPDQTSYLTKIRHAENDAGGSSE